MSLDVDQGSLNHVKYNPRAYVHKIHLLILWYTSPLQLRILKICKLHEIPYEMLHK